MRPSRWLPVALVLVAAAGTPREAAAGGLRRVLAVGGGGAFGWHGRYAYRVSPAASAEVDGGWNAASLFLSLDSAPLIDNWVARPVYCYAGMETEAGLLYTHRHLTDPGLLLKPEPVC